MMPSSKKILLETVQREYYDLALARIGELSSRVTQLESTWQQREMDIKRQVEASILAKLQQGKNEEEKDELRKWFERNI
jgi:hypothetical protein